MFSPSMVVEYFSGCSSQGWHPWSLRVCRTAPGPSGFSLLEKSGVTRISPPLSFSFASFATLALFCMCSVLVVMHQRDFFLNLPLSPFSLSSLLDLVPTPPAVSRYLDTKNFLFS